MEDTKELILDSLNGEPCTVTPEMLRLDSLRMTSETQVEEEVFLFRHFGKPCFPRKELTSITGPAKSGKTFFTSMLMACCIRQQVMTLERVRKEPLRVMWYDTEQSRNTTKEILTVRISSMIGLKQTDDFPDEQFFVFNMRSASVKERRELLGVAVNTYRPDLVILDGISDLLNDINDGPRATELVEELMQLADAYDCNITAIIHLNRSGDKNNLRGWLGTAMLQKSFEVFNCAQILQTDILSVEQSVSRKYRCRDTLYYQVDENGIPLTSPKPDVQPRDERGRWTDTKESKPDNLNRDYIISHADNPAKPWEWDLQRLFSDAMGNIPSMSDEQMKEAVMKLSGIRQYQYYYKVLAEAESRNIVRRVLDRYRRVTVVLVPPR